MNIQQIALIAQVMSKKGQNDAPNYRAHSVPQERCFFCNHFVRDTECDLYNFAADIDYVCNSFVKEKPVLQANLDDNQ